MQAWFPQSYKVCFILGLLKAKKSKSILEHFLTPKDIKI